MPVNAMRLIRKMRGGAQAHLIEADDGHFYVVKFRNNPQHRRVLINEWIASTFLQYLQVAAPETAIVRLTPEFLAQNPDVSIALGNEKRAGRTGMAFRLTISREIRIASPFTTFVPDTLLDRIENRNEFLGVLVFDKWTGNADARQSIFLRARLREYVPTFQGHALRVGFLAMMVDHGYIFNGPHWDYADSPLMGLYFRPSVYSRCARMGRFSALAGSRCELSRKRWWTMRSARLPAEWLNGDRDALYALLEKLMARRTRGYRDLIEDCRRSRSRSVS